MAKGTPAHVKAAILYNDVLVHKNLDKKHEKIANGEKIKWTYLKKNTMNLDTMALKGYEDPAPLENFVKEYIDYNKIFKSAFANKLNDFYAALGWGQIPENNNLGKFFSF